MPESIELTATTADGTLATANEQGSLSLAVAGDEAITVVATVAPSDWAASDLALTRGTTSVDSPPLREGDRATWTLSGEHRFGIFVATATAADGTTTVTSVSVTVTETATTPEPAPDEPGEQVANVPIGEYDAAYARWATGIATAFAAALLLALAALAVVGLTADGADFAIRARASTTFMLVAVGALLLVAGTVMAALETRGRLKAGSAAEVELDAVSRGPISDLVGKLPELLEATKGLRGTIAALVAGVVVLTLATILGFNVNRPAGTPQATPSPTASTDAATATATADATTTPQP
jgi:hypothetical protein